MMPRQIILLLVFESKILKIVCSGDIFSNVLLGQTLRFGEKGASFLLILVDHMIISSYFFKVLNKIH